MSGPALETGAIPVPPRPGIVRALAITNIAGSIILALYAASTAVSTLAMGMMGSSIPIPSPGPGKPAAMSFEFMSGPIVIRYLIADVATALVLNALMFASGIGLVNQKRWGATLWSRTAWAKIVRLILLEGYFIVVVGPAMSAGMARMAMSMFQGQRMPPKGMPTLAQLTTLYGYVFMAVGVGMIVFGVIYPAVSIWLLGRPGVKAVLDPNPPREIAPLD